MKRKVRVLVYHNLETGEVFVEINPPPISGLANSFSPNRILLETEFKNSGAVILDGFVKPIVRIWKPEDR